MAQRRGFLPSCDPVNGAQTIGRVGVPMENQYVGGNRNPKKDAQYSPLPDL
jgi:hypothetical protein